jgi:ubiquinone/menaquinone biosynthesis C-methylase UbiE
LAPVYGWISAAFGLRRGIRSSAVERLELTPSDSVLEVGCGRGDNLRLLEDAVGISGRVAGTDISAGMLERAEDVCRREGWGNVELTRQDAAGLELEGRFDAILFSLSYSVMADRARTLAKAWDLLLPGGRLVIMDAGLPDNRAGRVLGRATRALSRASVLGDPSTRPWDDLAAIGAVNVGTLWMAPGTYFVCWGSKPAETSVPPL